MTKLPFLWLSLISSSFSIYIQDTKTFTLLGIPPFAFVCHWDTCIMDTFKIARTRWFIVSLHHGGDMASCPASMAQFWVMLWISIVITYFFASGALSLSRHIILNLFYFGEGFLNNPIYIRRSGYRLHSNSTSQIHSDKKPEIHYTLRVYIASLQNSPTPYRCRGVSTLKIT